MYSVGYRSGKKIFMYISNSLNTVYAESYVSPAVLHLLYKLGTTYVASICSVLLVSYLSLYQYHTALIIYYSFLIDSDIW